ncbi:hypothetical protein HN51_019390 [Arachis hypogaea]
MNEGITRIKHSAVQPFTILIEQDSASRVRHRLVTSVAGVTQSPPSRSHLRRPVTSVVQQPSFVGTATSITQQPLEGAFELPRVSGIYDLIPVKLRRMMFKNLWQRGLSLYYLDRFEEGAEQFRLDVAQNPNDTEESIWCFLCETQLYGVDEARKRYLEDT